MTEEKIKVFKFDKKPSFAKLWDMCLYNLMYNISKYTSEIEKFMKRESINKKSKIIDLSAGSGFLSLELAEKGYSVQCMDASDDMLSEFKNKASEKGLDISCKKLKWSEIPRFYKKDSFDLAFCRGNSFIYAAGGWNEFKNVDSNVSLKAYEQTLKNFYDILKTGGVLYIDKFKDDEIPGKALVGKVIISGEAYDLLFYTEIKRQEGFRRASMLLRDKNGKEEGLPNMTYILGLPDLINLLKKVGFKEIKKLNLKSETHFDVLVAKK